MSAHPPRQAYHRDMGLLDDMRLVPLRPVPASGHLSLREDALEQFLAAVDGPRFFTQGPAANPVPKLRIELDGVIWDSPTWEEPGQAAYVLGIDFRVPEAVRVVQSA